MLHLFRYHESCNIVPQKLQEVHVIENIWSLEECEMVLNALIETTNKIGWTKKRHTAYATTDVPAYRISSKIVCKLNCFQRIVISENTNAMLKHFWLKRHLIILQPQNGLFARR